MLISCCARARACCVRRVLRRQADLDAVPPGQGAPCRLQLRRHSDCDHHVPVGEPPPLLVQVPACCRFGRRGRSSHRYRCAECATAEVAAHHQVWKAQHGGADRKGDGRGRSCATFGCILPHGWPVCVRLWAGGDGPVVQGRREACKKAPPRCANRPSCRGARLVSSLPPFSDCSCCGSPRRPPACHCGPPRNDSARPYTRPRCIRDTLIQLRDPRCSLYGFTAE